MALVADQLIVQLNLAPDGTADAAHGVQSLRDERQPVGDAVPVLNTRVEDPP